MTLERCWLEVQLRDLEKAGCSKVFREELSSIAATRPELEAALEWVRDGDILVVTKLDRLARSVADLVAITGALKRKGVGLRILSMNLDTGTPTGKLMVNLLGKPLSGLSLMGGGPGEAKKMAINHMHLAPRCTATSKRSGVACRAPAVKGKRVCRMHGAKAGGPTGSAHGRYVHGRETQQAKAARKEVPDLFQCGLRLQSRRDLIQPDDKAAPSIGDNKKRAPFPKPFRLAKVDLSCRDRRHRWHWHADAG